MRSRIGVVSSGRCPPGGIRAWRGAVLFAALCSLLPAAASAAVTTFFDSAQVATLVSTGTTSDTISSEGYQFTYTRDKLFTGGIGLTNPVGRTVRVPWPQGVEAQAVTVGPSLSGGKIVLERVDGTPFALSAFTARLLANTGGAGAQFEIMPLLNGDDALKDPLYFDATGYYGGEFSYDTSANYLGSTALLTNFEAYVITLYVDFALTALTLESDAPVVNDPPTDLDLSGGVVAENEPPDTWVGSFSTIDPNAGDTFFYALAAGTGSADNASFTISGDSLLTAAPFNFEVKSNYTIRVQSEDQGGLFTQKVFAVAVADVDEPPPVLLEAGSATDGGMVLSWSSITTHQYAIHFATNLLSGFTLLESNIAATPVMNVYTDRTASGPRGFWRVTTEP